jgi:4-hydroxy-tetrahydrodipicolinate synthase
MTKPLFTGVCTALVTPFLDGKVNYPMAEQLLRRQIEAGITTVVVAGTTGESPTLSDDEKIELFRRCKEYAGDACRIIAGTGTNATEHAISLSVAAEEAGVDGLLVVSPYYNKATPDGLFSHYLAIAHSVRLPIILYNVPSRTGVDLKVEVLKEICAHPRIVGIKEAGDSTERLAAIAAHFRGVLHLYAGNDSAILPVLALGGAGCISVLSNLLPAEWSAVWRLWQEGKTEEAKDAVLRLVPLIELLFRETNPAPIKCALALTGQIKEELRLPLAPVNDGLRKEIQARLGL